MLLFSRRSVACLALAACAPAALAQASPREDAIPAYVASAPEGSGAFAGGSRSQMVAPAARTGPFSTVAVTAKIGVLGVGVDLATPLSRKTNLRIGGNYFTYSDTLTSNGINFKGNLNFASAVASLDWFPWGRSFHISPGAMVFNGNRISANASVPAGTSFTIDNNNFVSSPTDPVGGNAKITFNKAAPMLTVGWGNPIPRNGRHFSFPVELGFAYVGDPKTSLNFTGTACDAQYAVCQPVSQNVPFQNSVSVERVRFQNNANDARFFPILSVGFSYRF
jgi:hypothetical protein